MAITNFFFGSIAPHRGHEIGLDIRISVRAVSGANVIMHPGIFAVGSLTCSRKLVQNFKLRKIVKVCFVSTQVGTGMN